MIARKIPRFRRPAVLPALLLVLWLGFSASYDALSEEISVSGTSLLRNGQSWIPRGVTIAGFSAPYAVSAQNYRAAHDRFGEPLLKSVTEFGADLVRFEVSQPGLDPQAPIYDSRYRNEFLSAIRLTRTHGFPVIISMKWFRASGMSDQPNMPSASTSRAWASLTGEVGKDTGAMLELFNEPGLYVQNPGAWDVWARTMQALINQVRSTGAQNVLVIDGLGWAHDLAGAPRLKDPLNKLVYGIHPYLEKGNRSRSEWNDRFGNFAGTRPVIVSEWNASSWSDYCYADMPKGAAELLKYLRQKHIGIVAWAFDFENMVRRDGTLTNLDNLQCGANTWNGAAQLLKDYFHSDSK